MRLFLVRSQVTKDPKTQQEICTIRWMKRGDSYPVFEVYKYMQTDKETQEKKIVTHFLVGDPGSGRLAWIDARVVDFVGE